VQQRYEVLADDELLAGGSSNPSPPAGSAPESHGRYGIEDSEFFADEPPAPAPAVDSAFLLFDEPGDVDASEDDAPGAGEDPRRGRRARRNR
jgi:hypothetical protein